MLNSAYINVSMFIHVYHFHVAQRSCFKNCDCLLHNMTLLLHMKLYLPKNSCKYIKSFIPLDFHSTTRQKVF